jgi:enoyl-CoA hydratase
MTEHARLIEHEQSIEVVFDRDEKLNALDTQMYDVLRAATQLLATRDDLRCLVISAKGRYFSAGNDLRDRAGHSSGESATLPAQPGWNYRRDYRVQHLVFDELEAVEKPILAAIQGPCLGAGLQMALSCDFRFCSERAEFALPEVKMGACRGAVGPVG